MSNTDQDKPKTVRFKNKNYKLPADPRDWDLEAMEAFEDGRIATAIRGVLGKTAWNEIKASGAKVRDLESLAEKIAKVYDFEAVGESSASTD